MNILSAPVSASAGDLSRAVGVDQIVDRMIQANKKRTDDLKGYTEDRTYSVTYHGFPLSLSATMVVEATYEAPETKHFRILSLTGSKLLADRVLKRLLSTEEAAAHNPQETALDSANYSFTLVGQESVDGRPCYLLAVVPRSDNKLLYRGTIWVDAGDYAVTKIDAEPAQNPSFWIRSTQVHHVYSKTGNFWLPEHNESDTHVRMGGSAVLTIDYGTYRTASSAEITMAPPSPITASR